MSNERPEFRPVEAPPARRAWPYAVLGAIIAGLLIFIFARREGVASQPKQVSLATVAPKGEAQGEAKAANASPAQPASAPAAAPQNDSPNVIGNAVAAAGKLAMVARAELDRELDRTKSAQKQAEAYRRQIAALQKELGEARAQIAALHKAQAPPPPSDQEQILQMLAPVLRSGNDGHP